MTTTEVAPVPDGAEDTDPIIEDGSEAATAAAAFDTARDTKVLIVTPFLLVALAGWLYYYVNSADMDSAERSALDWSTKLYPQLRTQIDLTLWSTLLVLVIAIPLGIILTRPIFRKDASEVGRRSLPRPVRLVFGSVSPSTLAVANIGQALPAYGLFIIFLYWQGQGFRTSVLALTVFALLPVLRNTMVGLEQVDPSVIEAGRGMGMGRFRVLTRIELPLAVPVILAGIRTALVINVGMGALAFLIGGGGLGITINSGLKLSRDLITVTGAAMVAILALTIDWLAAVAERLLRPKGL